MPLSPGDAGWLQQLAFRDALRPTHSCCAPMPNRNLQSALAAHDDQADDNAVVVRLSDPKPGSIHRRATTRWPAGGAHWLEPRGYLALPRLVALPTRQQCMCRCSLQCTCNGRPWDDYSTCALRSVDGSITHMAVAWRCELCGADLSVAVSCQRALRPGVVRFGSEFGSEHAAACRDCGVPVGGVHHLGCAVAWCSVHDAQRLRCDCDRELSPPTGGSKSLHPRELD